MEDNNIRDEVFAILRGADLETITSRKVRAIVAERLGIGQYIDQYRSVIETAVDDFLKEQQAPPLAEATPVEKRKSTSEPEEGRAPKLPKAAAASPDEMAFELSHNRKVSVREFNSRTLIDIREFYEKEGELKPGAKGLALSQDQWKALVENFGLISQAVEAGNAGLTIDLGNKRLASVGSYKSRLQVDLREHYDKDGQLAPGKKGIALTVEQFEALRSVADRITAAAGKAESEPAKQDAPGPSNTATPAANSSAFVDLGQNRRAAVSNFKGNMLLNLREYYLKGGEWNPGKKGISLSKEQAGKLHEKLEELTAALASKNQISIPLGNSRYAKISEYKKNYSVDVREYYLKDGEEKPGQKGLSMPHEQWEKLTAAMPALIAQL